MLNKRGFLAHRSHSRSEDEPEIRVGEKTGRESCSEQSLAKEFLEAGKKRLAGDTRREATSGEVMALRRESGALKEVVAELILENRLLKKSTIVDGGDRE